MEQLVFGYFRDMLEQEAYVDLMKASIIEDAYDKKNYPRCLDDLTKNEMIKAFGENTFKCYEEDTDWNKIESGHLVILRSYERDKEKFLVEKMILDGSKRGYQLEMICSIIGSCLAIPEKILNHHIFLRKNVEQISHIFKYPKEGVKIRLIEFYYNNIILTLEKYK